MSPVEGEEGALLVDLAHGRGGAEERVLQLAAGLPGAGVSTRIVALRDSPLAREATARRLPVSTLGSRRADPRNVSGLRRLLGRHPGWAVDAHNTQSQLVALAATLGGDAAGRQMVATVHSDYRRSERHGPRLRGGVLRLAHHAGWMMIAVSDGVAGYLRTLRVPPARIRTVLAGVDLPDPIDRREARTALGIADDRPVVLAVGRLVVAKNYPLLLRCFADLRRSHPDAVLLIAGAGPQRMVLSGLASELGLTSADLAAPDAVRFLGHRADVPRLLAAADVCLLTSHTEGLPYALLEAAVAGVPIVASAVGAIPSVFGDGAALLAAPDAPSRVFADRLAAVLDDPALRARLRGRARLRVGELSVGEMVDRTVAAYREKGNIR